MGSMAKTFRNFSDYHQTRKALLFRDTKTQNMRNLDLFVTFCQETSLHGWAYLVNDDKSSWLTRIKRILWSMVIVASIASAIAVIAVRILQFENSDVVTKLESRTGSLSKVFFPSV